MDGLDGWKEPLMFLIPANASPKKASAPHHAKTSKKKNTAGSTDKRKEKMIAPRRQRVVR
jgi:hypothetical protein